MHGSIGNLVELLNKCINGGKYRGISRACGIPYRRFTYRGIPFIPVYRATLDAWRRRPELERRSPALERIFKKKIRS